MRSTPGINPRLITTLVLPAALAIACSESVGPSDERQHTRYVARPPGHAAELGRSSIIRFQQEFVIITRHDEAGLISITGWPGSVAQLCNGVGTGDLMDFQVKPHSAAEVNAMISNRNASVQILALTPDQRLCRDLQNAPVLYQGTAALRRTDNNFTDSGTEGGRANSFGWRINGGLEDLVHGGQVHYTEDVRIVSNPRTGEFLEVVVRIALG